MAGQAGFFDGEERLKAVSAAVMIEKGTLNDFLARITAASLYACAKLKY